MQEEQYSPGPEAYENPDAQSPALPNQVESISWSASEYIAHHKSPQWYAMLGLSAALIAIIVWFLTRDAISAAVVLVGAAVLGAYGARQPRELQYYLDTSTLSVAGRKFNLDEFRSFTVDDQQAIASVNLLPLKRFAPGISIYFAPQDEEAIIGLLSTHLPFEEHRSDPIDKLMRWIRF